MKITGRNKITEIQNIYRRTKQFVANIEIYRFLVDKSSFISVVPPAHRCIEEIFSHL